MATKKDVMSVQEQLKNELAQLKERVEPPSGYMIGTKGKMFNMPDGSAHEGPLICVILDWCTANTYYAANYNPQNVQPPTCFAIGRNPKSIVPSDNSPKKQCDRCVGDADNAGCPKNEWGSDPGGGKGKACKNTRRVLLAAADAEDGSPQMIISVSPTGLKHFDKYINTLTDMGVHPIEIITEISFDPSEAYPSLRFKAFDKHANTNVMWKLKEHGQEILFQEPRLETKAA